MRVVFQAKNPGAHFQLLYGGGGTQGEGRYCWNYDQVIAEVISAELVWAKRFSPPPRKPPPSTELGNTQPLLEKKNIGRHPNICKGLTAAGGSWASVEVRKSYCGHQSVSKYCPREWIHQTYGAAGKNWKKFLREGSPSRRVWSVTASRLVGEQGFSHWRLDARVSLSVPWPEPLSVQALREWEGGTPSVIPPMWRRRLSHDCGSNEESHGVASWHSGHKLGV